MFWIEFESRVRETNMSAHQGRYSYVIVGAGIIGSALAYALATEERRVLLIERDFSEPGNLSIEGGSRMRSNAN